jgi:hypothetical protein
LFAVLCESRREAISLRGFAEIDPQLRTIETKDVNRKRDIDRQLSAYQI